MRPHLAADQRDRNGVVSREQISLVGRLAPWRDVRGRSRSVGARHQKAWRVSGTGLRAGSVGHVAQVLGHLGARRLGEDAPADDG